MRFDVYKGGDLAATFVYGTAPRYYGACGQEIAALIEVTPVIYNFWTRETDVCPVTERADWWASRIICAPLAKAGFVLRAYRAALMVVRVHAASAHRAVSKRLTVWRLSSWACSPHPLLPGVLSILARRDGRAA